MAKHSMSAEIDDAALIKSAIEPPKVRYIG
jgi:hypothetical protein